MVSKSKLCLILTSFIATVSLSCAPNMINNVLQTSNGSHNTGISFEEYKKRERNELLTKIQNKTDKNYQIENLIINTAMLNNSGKVFRLQSENVRTKKFQLGKHPTNESHIQSGESIIFDPKNPDSLKNLQAYEGNSVSKLGNPVSSMKVNNDITYDFEPDVAIIRFKSVSGLNLFKSLYNAEVQAESDGYYKLKVDVSKATIEKTEELLERLNTKFPENIKNIEFSSLAAMKLFIIMSDFVLNHISELESMEFNLFIENQAPIIDVNDWRHVTTLVQYNPPGDTTEMNSWWLTETNVISPYRNPTTITKQIDIGASAWDYSIGTGAKVAVLDNGFNEIHPEFMRRFVKNEPGNDFSHNVLNTEYTHGTEMSMVIGAERNNDIGSVGVAPNVTIAPYFNNENSWDAGERTKSAVANGAKIINMSFARPNEFWKKNVDIRGDVHFFAEILNAVRDHNVTIIASAGNWAKPIDTRFPANLSDISGIIVVGGVDILPDDINPGSNFGKHPLSLKPDNTASFYPDVDPDPLNKRPECKTGHNGLDPNDLCNDFKGKGSNYGTNLVWAPWQYYVWASPIKDIKKNSFPPEPQGGGTSAAAAFVSGTISLMLSRNPDLTPPEIENILHNTATIPVNIHEYMRQAKFNDSSNSMKLIDVRAAVETAIKERKFNNDPNNFKAKDFGFGYFELDKDALKDNPINNIPIGTITLMDGNGTKLRLLRTASDEEFKAADKNVVNLKGWEPDISGFTDGIEVLSLEVLPIPIPNINIISPTGTITEKDFVRIWGDNLFSLLTTELVFRDISTNIEYIFKIERTPPPNDLGRDGKYAGFTFESAKALSNVPNGTGGFVSLADVKKNNPNAEFAISYKVYNTRSKDFINTTAKPPIMPYKIKAAVFPDTKTYDGKPVPVPNDDSKTKISTGQLIAVPIPTQLTSTNLKDFSLNIGGQQATVKEILDWYLIALVPPGISKDAEKVIIGYAGGGNITYEQAIEMIAVSVGLKPPAPVNYPQTGVTLQPEQYVSSDNTIPVKVVKNGVFGIAVNGNLNDISIMADGNRCTLLEVVNNYALYRISPNVVPEIKNLIIEQAGGGTITTLDKALEVLAVSIGVKPQAPVSFTNGTTLKPEEFVSNDKTIPPVKVLKGGLYGLAINGDMDLNNISIIADGKRSSLLSVVQNYALYRLAPEVDSGIKNLIIEQAGGGTITTLEQALEVLALTIGPKPSAPVTFVSGDIMQADKFVDADPVTPPVKLFPGDTFGISFNAKVNPADVSVFANGQRCTLQSVIDNYMSFKVPPTMDPAIINLVIQYAGGGDITLERALEILAIQAPVSDKIVFSPQTNYSDFTKIYTINPDGTGLTELVSSVNSGQAFSVAWSPDKTKIAYGYRDQSVYGYQIYTMNADGSNKTKITNGENDAYPYWSHDGKKIAYLSTRMDTNTGIRNYGLSIVDADGANQHDLVRYTNMDIYNDEISWSYDGTKIVYTAFEFSGRRSLLYTINTDGTNNNLINTDGSYPQWTIDNKIIFGEGLNVTRINDDGTSPVIIGPGELASVSMDGKKVAFVSVSEQDIYTANTDGTDLRNLTNSPSGDWVYAPNWSADGTALLFIRQQTYGHYQIGVVNSDGSNLHTVHIDDGYIDYLKWSIKNNKDRRRKASTDLPKFSW